MRYQETLELHEHPELKDLHAPFSPSQFYWINYDREKLINFWDNRKAQQIGTDVHSFAAEQLRQEYYFRENNLPFSNRHSHRDIFSLFINHSIDNWMKPEVAVKYSDICFGHADSLAFNLKKRTLYINDLKTGKHPAAMDQLEIYAAIFFAEYSPTLQFEHFINIEECKTELRIFQNNEIILSEPPMDYLLNERLGKIRLQHEILSQELDRRAM